MVSLLERVRRTVVQHELCPPGTRLVVAVSGGADSVALTFLLLELRDSLQFEIAGLAHLNHGLRGRAAAADEAFCRRLAATLDLPLTIGRARVRETACREGLSLEEAGRIERYAFLERTRVARRADRVAVGHTRDDQAETLLLNLIRGAGTRGLRGMLPRAGHVIRPLIDTAHGDLVRYLRSRHLPFREDATNRDVAFLRNRVRHRLIPYLRRSFSRGISDVLARTAAIAREETMFLEAAADRRWPRVAEVSSEGVALDVRRLLAEPLALRRRLGHRALEVCAGGRFVGFDHVEALLALAAASPGTARTQDLPGQRLERCGNRLILRPADAVPNRLRRAIRGRRRLPVPGAVAVPEAGVLISAREQIWRPRDVVRAARGRAPTRMAVVDAAMVADGLWIRGRRPGDRLRPYGLAGHKSIQDLFVDRKVPRAERDATPLVVDSSDRIVWVAGHAAAEDFQVTAATKAVVILELGELGARE